MITEISGKKIEDYRDLIRTVNYYDPGETVEVKYSRKGKSSSVKVELGERKRMKRHHFKLHHPEGKLLLENEYDVQQKLEKNMRHLEDNMKGLEKKLKRIEILANKIPVTVSIGIAERGEADMTPHQAIKKAEKALLTAKNEGRDRMHPSYMKVEFEAL